MTLLYSLADFLPVTFYLLYQILTAKKFPFKHNLVSLAQFVIQIQILIHNLFHFAKFCTKSSKA